MEKFFANVIEVFRKRDRRFATTFYHKMNPMIYNQEGSLIGKFEELKASIPKELEGLQLLVEDSIEELTQVMKALSLFP